MLFKQAALSLLLIGSLTLHHPVLANETNTTDTTTTTTTTIPGETEEVETFDGPPPVEEEELEEETTTTTTTSTTTTTTVPTYEQATDIELPEDELDLDGNEVENNIVIDDTYDGEFGCTDFCMNLHYFQHGNDSEDYTFILPETTTVEEEELDIEIYEVGFTIGALNNEGTVTYTHTDETTQENVLEAQSNSNLETMLEKVVYNIYDTLDTFIESFTITINDWSLLDDISFKYVMPTTTTTTTTTLPPPPEPKPEPEPEPEPEPVKIVVVLDDGSEAEYQEHEIEDGTVERDNERKANEDKFGCYMTDAQIERGDCDIIEEDEEQYDTEEEFSDDDDVVLDLELEDEVEELEPIKEEDIVEEEIEIDVKELEEEIEVDIDLEIEVVDIPEETQFEDDIVEEELEDELDQEILRDDKVREDEVPIKDEETQEEIVEDTLFKQPVVELTDEEVAIEVAEVEEIIEDIVIEEVTTEEVIEVIQQVNDIGVQNLDQATEEVQEVVQAVVEEAIENVEELTEEQVSVVAEVLQVEEDDVEIIAEAVKDDEVIAEAVEEYVQRAVDNADVENYTLADVVTEKTYEAFLENPIETFVDLDFEGITINNIGDDMTQDQKEKAQEVVVPVILTRIATMAAFVFRRSL